MPLSPNHRGRSVMYLASICLLAIVFALATTALCAKQSPLPARFNLASPQKFPGKGGL
jgi:hypothetical protein